MRLTNTERQILRAAARGAFGDDARVYLFGSRVDDSKRGGDIDLLVETAAMDSDAIFTAWIRFLARAKLALGVQIANAAGAVSLEIEQLKHALEVCFRPTENIVPICPAYPYEIAKSHVIAGRCIVLM